MTEKDLKTLALLVLKFAEVLADSQEQQEQCIDIAIGALSRAQEMSKDDEPTRDVSKIPF